MKKEQIKSYLSLVVAAMLSQVVACSPPNDAHESNHAGVLTETESGHTVAFTLHSYVDEYNPKQSAKVNFALTKIVDGKTKLLDSATVKYGDYAVFEDITGAYSVVATATGLNGEKDTLYGVDVLKRNDMDTVYVRVQEPATLKISTSYTETVKSSHGEETQEIFSEGSTLCITGTLTCKKISKDDIKRGYAIVKNIPLFDNEDYVKQIEIQSGKELRTLGVEWNFSAGDTLYASESVIAEKRWLDFDFELPESDMYDTIGGAVMDSLIVPVKIADDDFYHYNWNADFFLDQLGNVMQTVLFIIAFSFSCVVLLGFGFTLLAGHMDFTEASFSFLERVPEKLAYVVVLLVEMALCCLIYWLAYRLYCRAQVTTPRNP